MLNKVSTFFGEVKSELRKATWPWEPASSNIKGFKKYKTLIDSTIVVLVSIVLLAAFVAVSDLLLQKAVGLITMLSGGN